MEKCNDSHSTYDSSYVNNNNNITKSLNEPDIDNRQIGRVDDDEEQKMSKNRCPSREISKIWSPLRNSSSPSSSSELDVKSRLTSPDIDVTKCNTPSPITVQATINPSLPLLPPVQTIAKNSEAFSVSALLKPDVPRTRHPYNHHHHHHHQPAMASETISVTRSLLYPVVQFPDLIKDTRKEVYLHPSTTNTLLHKHFSSFSFHPHFYSAANILSPSGSPEHSGGSGGGGGGDSNIDNNHNLLTSSLYLNLGAVQAAAAAAFVHPLSTTGILCNRITTISQFFHLFYFFQFLFLALQHLKNFNLSLT